MAKAITYLANPRSPHVQRWLKLVTTDVTVLSIQHRSQRVHAQAYQHVTYHSLGPALMKLLPAVIQYMIAGFVLRCSRHKPSLLHAHNTSGYGLLAYLSGLPYAITTYGSEIYRCSHHRGLYRWLITRILCRAQSITVSSDALKTYLINELKVDPNKIAGFSLGYDNDAYFPDQNAAMIWQNRLKLANEYPIWIVNRRALPLYRVLEVVQGFESYRRQGGQGALIVLRGDSHGEYCETVQQHIEASPFSQYMRWVDPFLSQTDLRGILSLADFSWSIPVSDQLSASIIESLACNAIPILSNLPAYKALFAHRCAISLTNIEEVASYFGKTAALSDEKKGILRDNAQHWLNDQNNTATASLIGQWYQSLSYGQQYDVAAHS